MMLSSLVTRRISGGCTTLIRPGVVASLSPVTRSVGINSDGTPYPQTNSIQARTMVTKKRQHRQAKRKRKEELAERGIFPPKPLNYIPVDTPVVNAVSRPERDAESKRQDVIAAEELKAKMDIVQAPLLRFDFNGEDLIMSETVKKLFDLHNGNQSEVVKAQKQRGMGLFQLREGDTGSSATQGTFCISTVSSFFLFSPSSFFSFVFSSRDFFNDFVQG